MRILKKIIVPILVTGIWINISETVRWMFLVESYWLEKYQILNLTFPNETINMIAWMLWGFFHATVIFILSRRYNLFHTAVLSWFVAFVMMWLVVWNVGVLPTGMLWFNIPLSLLEAFIGAYICIRFFKLREVST
jgi:hypothetical protein